MSRKGGETWGTRRHLLDAISKARSTGPFDFGGASRRRWGWGSNRDQGLGTRDQGREEEVIFRRSSINGRQRSYVFSVTPNCDGCHRGIVE